MMMVEAARFATPRCSRVRRSKAITSRCGPATAAGPGRPGGTGSNGRSAACPSPSAHRFWAGARGRSRSATRGSTRGSVGYPGLAAMTDVPIVRTAVTPSDRVGSREVSRRSRWPRSSCSSSSSPMAPPWVISLNLVAFYALFLRAILAPDRILPRLPSYFSIEVLFLAYSYLIFYYPYQLFVIGARTSRGEQVRRQLIHRRVEQGHHARRQSGCSRSRSVTGCCATRLLVGAVGARRLRPVPVATSRMTPGPVTSAPCRQRRARCSSPSSPCTWLAGWRTAGEGRYTGTTTAGLGIEGSLDRHHDALHDRRSALGLRRDGRTPQTDDPSCRVRGRGRMELCGGSSSATATRSCWSRWCSWAAT